MSQPADQFRAELHTAFNAEPNGWVVSGNYYSPTESFLAQTEAIIWLRLHFHLTFWRLLRHAVQRSCNKERLWGTNTEFWLMSIHRQPKRCQRQCEVLGLRMRLALVAHGHLVISEARLGLGYLYSPQS